MKILITQNQLFLLREQIDVNNSNKEDLPSIIKRAGYNPGTPEYNIALFIGNHEVWSPKTRSFRNNNPGNLSGIDFKDIDPDVTLEDKGVYAKFSTPELGVKALVEKKIKKWANGKMPITTGNQKMIVDNKGGEKYIKGQKPTVAQFFYTYAPPSENDTELYINSFLKKIGVSDRNTLLIDIINK